MVFRMVDPERRWWGKIASALIVMMLFGFGSPQPATAQQTIRVGHFPNITHLHALVARSFEREGRHWIAEHMGVPVKIEWYAYNAGPSAMEAVFAHALDVTFVGPSPAINAYARSRGHEVRIIAGAVNGGAALVVQPGSGLSKPSDFRGKRIATPQFGNTQDVAARAWLINGGLRITQTGGDASVVPTQNPEQLSLFQQKSIDAVWTVEPWVSRLEMEAGGEVLVEEQDAVTTILVARAAFLDQHRDLARRFTKAHAALTEWISANPAETKRRVREELKASFRVEMPEALVERSFSRLRITTDVSPEAFAAVIRSAQRVGFLRDAPDIGRLIEIP
jgi:NitT/TauT family transport system substrate-binding protein